MNEDTLGWWDEPPFCVAGYESGTDEYAKEEERDDFAQLATAAEEQRRSLARVLRRLPRHLPKESAQEEELAGVYERAAELKDQLSMTVHRMGESIQRIRDESRRCEGNAEIIRQDRDKLFGAAVAEEYGSALASEEAIVQRTEATRRTLESVIANARKTLCAAEEKVGGWHTAPDAHFDNTQVAGGSWPKKDAVTELIDVSPAIV